MPKLKKIIVSLPEELLEQVDDVLMKEKKKSRSQWFREAAALYLTEIKRAQIQEQMKKGYEEMGLLNLRLSEEGLAQDLSDLVQYEKILESE